jgi:hypothetical protein
VKDIFCKIDSQMPEPSCNIGQVARNQTPWEQERKRYAFVDELAAIRDQIQGAGNLARFDYWLNSFRYLQSMARLGCTLGQLDRAMAAVAKETDPAKKKQLAREQALPRRLQIPSQWRTMMTHVIASVGSAGELGTVSDLEQTARPNDGAGEKYDRELEKILGEPLGSKVELAKNYSGPARIIVPTVRTLVAPGERLALKVIILTPGESKDAPLPTGQLFWREMGKGKFAKLPLQHVARGVCEVQLPSAPKKAEAIEYYIRATSGTNMLIYPPTAPALNQTVIVGAATES